MSKLIPSSLAIAITIDSFGVDSNWGKKTQDLGKKLFPVST